MDAHAFQLSPKHTGTLARLPAGAEHLSEGDKAELLLSLKTTNLGSVTWCWSQVRVLTESYIRAKSSPLSCATWTALLAPSCCCWRIPQVSDTLQGFRPTEAQLSPSACECSASHKAGSGSWLLFCLSFYFDEIKYMWDEKLGGRAACLHEVEGFWLFRKN